VAERQRVLSVNLTGAFLIAKAAIPHLLRRPGGNLINVASTAGLRGMAYAAHYAASKAGLINFTRSIALEFASRGLRANCLAPAGVVTPIIAHFMPRPDFEPSLVAYYSPPTPNRMSQPEDVAKAILVLASDDCPMITGATLLADWGRLRDRGAGAPDVERLLLAARAQPPAEAVALEPPAPDVDGDGSKGSARTVSAPPCVLATTQRSPSSR
jgi:NAD(P)-dependent dehydrogenase (short-subunit alcohol dehydrogenase family)